MTKRIILMSDVHHCHVTWNGLTSEERMERLVESLNEAYRREPFEQILFLGDYSLDFWAWEIKGCYLSEGRSYTREFVTRYAPRLPAPYIMIPGNHEQYGPKTWREITGFDRQGCYVTDGWLFILLDTFAGDLDPTEHSDGTYTPMDVRYARASMDRYPDHRVVLCAHHFDPAREPEASRELVRDSRVVCLASGHVHLSDVLTLPEDWGGKKLLRTGQFSYTAGPDPRVSLPGWREVVLTDDQLISRYVTPAGRYVLGGEPYEAPWAAQDEAVIALR